MTKDGVVVVSHDNKLKRQTGHDILVSETKFAVSIQKFLTGLCLLWFITCLYMPLFHMCICLYHILYHILFHDGIRGSVREVPQ